MPWTDPKQLLQKAKQSYRGSHERHIAPSTFPGSVENGYPVWQHPQQRPAPSSTAFKANSDRVCTINGRSSCRASSAIARENVVVQVWPPSAQFVYGLDSVHPCACKRSHLGPRLLPVFYLDGEACSTPRLGRVGGANGSGRMSTRCSEDGAHNKKAGTLELPAVQFLVQFGQW